MAEVEPYGPLVIGVDPARFGDDRSIIRRRRRRWGLPTRAPGSPGNIGDAVGAAIIPIIGLAVHRTASIEAVPQANGCAGPRRGSSVIRPS